MVIPPQPCHELKSLHDGACYNSVVGKPKPKAKDNNPSKMDERK